MYLYEYEVYLIEIKNYKDALQPIIQDVIIYEYIQSETPNTVYESINSLEMNK